MSILVNFKDFSGVLAKVARIVFAAFALTQLFLGSGSTLSAQESGLGGLRGRLQDKEFFSAIPGVEVAIEGRPEKVVTGDDGTFFIDALPPGVYNLVVGRSGYTRERVSNVVVNARTVTETDIELTAEVVELDDFVVSMEEIIENASSMSPTSLAADMQSFSTALGGDFLAKLGGGGDIGGAVTRLAGTSVVDSRYVVIRGLSDRYNVVVLNNARIPSSDPDKRAVNIDIFPSTLVERVVSSKTFTPDMPGEATGGFLNVVTKSIPDKPFVKFFLESGYNTQTSGNDQFLSSGSGGTGMLGTSQDRRLPGLLKATTGSTLPANPLPADVTAAQRDQIANNRDLSSRLLQSQSMGSITEVAPLDFAASLSGGSVFEDFFGGRLGVIGALSYSKRYELDQGHRGAASINLAEGRSQMERVTQFQEGEQKLLAGALLSIGWEGPEQDKLGFVYFTNLAADDEATFGISDYRNLGVGSEPAVGFDAAARQDLAIVENNVYTERRLSTYQLLGEHILSDDKDIKIDWAAAYSTSSQDEPDIRFGEYTYNVPSGNFGTLPNTITDNPPFQRTWRRLDDSNYNLNMNIEVPIGSSSDGKQRSKIKFGGALDHSTRDYRSDNFEYRTLDLAGFTQAAPGALPSANNRRFLSAADQVSGRDVTPYPDGATALTDVNVLSRTSLPLPEETYTGDQNIGAVYAMATFNMTEDVEIMFGARVETTDIKLAVGGDFSSLDTSASGALLVNPITGEPISPELAQRPRLNSTDLLPAAGVSWKINDEVTLRSSISKTLARPTFKEIAPVLARDPVTGAFYIGNVSLETSEITNYDIRAEWFPNPDDFVILSVFSKLIQNPIETRNLGRFLTVGNEQEASIYGFEIELNKKLTEFGPLFEDISLGFNYAKMISQVILSDRSRASRTDVGLDGIRSLQGQPDYTMNFNASYSNEDHGLTMGVYLNITGDLLYQVGGRSSSQAVPDVFQESYTRLDFNISKEIYDDWVLALRVGNFLNTERRRDFRYQGQSVGPLEYLREGTVYAISLSKKW
jgi:TonB-dependent receptor